ncbi:hypothetical protein Tco_0337705 [Tanacetum coccineum]
MSSNYQPNVPQPRNNVSVRVGNKSFAVVLKTGTTNPNLAVESAPAIVLDDSCLLEHDFSYSLMGKIKDINAVRGLRRRYEKRVRALDDPVETKVDDWEFKGLFGVLLVDNVEEQRRDVK